MGLRKDVPGTTKPMYCSRNINGKKCGKPAVHTISGKVEIFEKLVNVKLAVCDEHFEGINVPINGFSIGETDE